MARSGLGTGDGERSPDATQHDAGPEARPRPADYVVSGLQTKLGLLVRYGYFESFEAVAKALGRSPKTVRWWGHGDPGRGRDRIPADRYERVLAVFRDCLTPDVPRELVEEVVLGPVSAMEDRLRAGDPRSIGDFIWSEGIMGLSEFLCTGHGLNIGGSGRLEAVFE